VYWFVLSPLLYFVEGEGCLRTDALRACSALCSVEMSRVCLCMRLLPLAMCMVVVWSERAMACWRCLSFEHDGYSVGDIRRRSSSVALSI